MLVPPENRSRRGESGRLLLANKHQGERIRHPELHPLPAAGKVPEVPEKQLQARARLRSERIRRLRPRYPRVKISRRLVLIELQPFLPLAATIFPKKGA